MDQLSEVDVEARAQDAASLTFDEFVAARGGALWRTAYLLTGDHHQADDLLQATLVKCWRRWSRIEPHGGRVDAYARKVMLTTYVDWRRRRWHGEVPTATLPEAVAIAESPRPEVLAALAGLPRQQRAVLILRFFEDLSVEQTADLLGISTGSVKTHSSRGLTALRASGKLSDVDE